MAVKTIGIFTENILLEHKNIPVKTPIFPHKIIFATESQLTDLFVTKCTQKLLNRIKDLDRMVVTFHKCNNQERKCDMQGKLSTWLLKSFW